MSRADGSRCGLHYNKKTCACDHHCTGCRHTYVPIQADCCTCCRQVEAQVSL